MNDKKAYELNDDALDEVVGGVAVTLGTVPGSNTSSVVAGGNTQSYVTPTGTVDVNGAATADSSIGINWRNKQAISGYTPVNSNNDVNVAATADSSIGINWMNKQAT